MADGSLLCDIAKNIVVKMFDFVKECKAMKAFVLAYIV